MGKICCILDSDESFAVRICACFNKKHVLPFSVQAFSDMDAYMSCAQNNEVELLIVDESLYEEVRHVPAGQIIRLCEQPMLMEGERFCILILRNFPRLGRQREICLMFCIITMLILRCAAEK